MRFGIIYRSFCPDGKNYIGQTLQSLDRRKKRHISNSNNKNNSNYNSKFYRAARKLENLLNG